MKEGVMPNTYLWRIRRAATISSAVLSSVVWSSGPAHAVDYVKLVSLESGKCLNVEGASYHDGARVIQWDCADTPNSHWRFEPVPGHPDYFRIHAGNSDKCLNVEGGSIVNGARLIQWPCTGNNNENWRAVDYEGYKFKLQAEHSGRCLNVEGASHANGAQVIQWDCVNTKNNRWWQKSWAP